MGTCKFYCHSRVLNKMLMLRSVTFNSAILNKRRDMLVEKLSMGSHYLGCNFKVRTFELDLLISIVSQ